MADKIALSFDDVMLVPRTGQLASRSEADTTSGLTNLKTGCYINFDIPIMSSPMESVTGPEMALAMQNSGGLGVLHRFGEMHRGTYGKLSPLAHAVGLKTKINAYADILVYDVAHADSEHVLEHVQQTKSAYKNKIVVVGSVATREGVRNAFEAGADAVRVGIGSGAACTTRTVTGFGVPMVQSIMGAADVAEEFGGAVIADGGIKNSGDIVKALAFGADFVMLGRLLAGCREAPIPGEYFGQASKMSSAYTGSHVEGESGTIPVTGTVAETIDALMQGVRSGISYGGARNIHELQQRLTYNVVSPLTAIETSVRI